MSDQAESIVMLHGFAGTHRTWDAVRNQLAGQLPQDRPAALLAPDLPGHGACWRDEPPAGLAQCALGMLERLPERFILCGYSLGARLALHMAIAAPERIAAMALVSGSPGIENDAERSARLESDRLLARRLEREPFERFIERWRDQPLFADEPAAARRMALAEHRRNDPVALAGALRAFSSGSMRPLWRELPSLTMPAAVIAGTRDRRYVRLARRMAGLLPDAQLELLPGGHSLALESPLALAEALSRLYSRRR